MTIREAKRQINIQQWKTIIQDRIDSGLAVDEYCKINNLSRHAYFYWLRLIREEELFCRKPVPESNGFVEVNLPAERPSVLPETKREYTLPEERDAGQTYLDLTVNGITVHVTENTSPGLLARTLEVIRNVK